jgi:hypothetical protein
VTTAAGGDQRLDLLVLRLAVAGDQARLRSNAGLEVRVLAAQLAELALAGMLVDQERRPVIVSAAAIARGAFDPVRDHVRDLAKPGWELLFWRTGIDAAAVLQRAVSELIDSRVWQPIEPAHRRHPARYADTDGAGLRAHAARLDAVITDRLKPSARDAILVALLALRFTGGPDALWREKYWVHDLPGLAEPQHVTVQRIIEAADETADLMRSARPPGSGLDFGIQVSGSTGA